MPKIVIHCDLTGYHPGAHSMTGWLVNNFLSPDRKERGEYSLENILENASQIVIRIENFHKMGFVLPSNIAWFLADIQVLIKKGMTFEFVDPFDSDKLDNYWQITR